MSDPQPKVLFSEEQIQTRVNELATTISADYHDVDDLILIGVLKGSFIFLADLSRRLTIPCSVDFLAVSTYGNETTTKGTVRTILDLRRNIEGKHVLVVEDIIDTGYTLAYLLEILSARKPASLKTCALVHKPNCRKMAVQIDYLGFEIADDWIVGYGLDIAEKYRTLPYIGTVVPS